MKTEEHAHDLEVVEAWDGEQLLFCLECNDYVDPGGRKDVTPD